VVRNNRTRDGEAHKKKKRSSYSLWQLRKQEKAERKRAALRRAAPRRAAARRAAPRRDSLAKGSTRNLRRRTQHSTPARALTRTAVAHDARRPKFFSTRQSAVGTRHSASSRARRALLLRLPPQTFKADNSHGPFCPKVDC